MTRSFAERETGTQQLVWLDASRIRGIDTNDACCGLAYDANRYDDTLASCAQQDDECGPDLAAVYPGLADDRVCGEKRRCVPLPLARLVIRDHTAADGVDADDRPLSTDEHTPVSLGRDGFVYVNVAGHTERIALDYGGRYTITIGGGRVEHVSRDD